MPHEKVATATLPTTQVVQSPDPADKLIAAKRRRDEEQRQREEDEANKNFVHFLRCPRDRGHVAAFLTELPRPGKPITPGHWYSRFRKPGEAYTKPFIQCQECQYDGERRPWIVALDATPRPEGGFDFFISEAQRRHVLGKMPRDAAESDVASNG